MKRFALIWFMVALLPWIAQAQDLTLIDLITVPQRSDTFAPQSTARLYRFYAESGATITSDMSPLAESALDPYQMVFSASGQILGVNDDAPDATDYASRLMVDTTESGEHFLLATSYLHIDGYVPDFGEEVVSYNLNVQGSLMPQPEDASSTLLDLGSVPFETTLPMQTPMLLMRFAGVENQSVNITASNATTDMVLMLFDGEGNRLAVNDDAESLELPHVTDAALEGIVLPTTGTYLLLATMIDALDAGYVLGEEPLGELTFQASLAE
ncbi:MAG: hypothetical protein ACOYLB_04610 [Phototrophicaceae bacterium]